MVVSIRVLAGALLAPTALLAQSRAIRVPPVEVHHLASKAVGDSFEIRVVLPPMLPGEATRFPVVYLTDVYGDFALGADMLRMYMVRDVPRFIAVGIGYPGASSILQATRARARDLTPVPVPVAETPGVLPTEGLRPANPPNGGAPQFLGFLRDELIPFIDARYPTKPDDRTYFGHSYGGLFGTWVLLTRPETFNRYIIGSPSIGWAGESILRTVDEYGQRHDDLRADVFMGVGALEEPEHLLHLADLLRARKFPGLKLTTQVFPDEGHVTVMPFILARGLRAVFGPVRPEDSFTAGLERER
jgi:predicted alpha/beta superfamily hydrolase